MRKDRGGVSRQRTNPILSRVADDAATGDAPATGPAPVGFCLAAGAGTRLRPLTGQVPKPLLAPAGRPLVDLACEALDRAGTREIVVNTHHGASQLAAHLDGRPGLHVLHEPELLGTGGALGNAYHLGLLGGGTVLVTSADVLVHPADLASVAAQLDRGGEVAIGLVPARPGLLAVRLDGDATIPGPAGPWAPAGVHALRAGVLEPVPPRPAPPHRPGRRAGLPRRGRRRPPHRAARRPGRARQGQPRRRPRRGHPDRAGTRREHRRRRPRQRQHPRPGRHHPARRAGHRRADPRPHRALRVSDARSAAAPWHWEPSGGHRPGPHGARRPSHGFARLAPTASSRGGRHQWNQRSTSRRSAVKEPCSPTRRSVPASRRRSPPARAGPPPTSSGTSARSTTSGAASSSSASPTAPRYRASWSDRQTTSWSPGTATASSGWPASWRPPTRRPPSGPGRQRTTPDGCGGAWRRRPSCTASTPSWPAARSARSTPPSPWTASTSSSSSGRPTGPRTPPRSTARSTSTPPTPKANGSSPRPASSSASPAATPRATPPPGPPPRSEERRVG